MAWAVWGATTLPQPSSSSSSSKDVPASQAAAGGQQQQPQQPQQQKAAGGVGGLQRLLQLPCSTLVQLGVLCYSHAVMGYCFFILQVGHEVKGAAAAAAVVVRLHGMSQVVESMSGVCKNLPPFTTMPCST
jgi:hypothetical protein